MIQKVERRQVGTRPPEGQPFGSWGSVCYDSYERVPLSRSDDGEAKPR